jgi:hypothetical protein
VIKGQEIVQQIEMDYGDSQGQVMRLRTGHRIEVIDCGEVQ